MTAPIFLLDSPGRRLAEVALLLRALCPDSPLEFVFDMDRLLAHLRDEGAARFVVIDYATGYGRDEAARAASHIRQAAAHLPILAIGEEDDPQILLRALEAGVNELAVKHPHLRTSLQIALQRIEPLEHLAQRNAMLEQQARRLLRSGGETSQIVGHSPQVLEMLSQIRRLAASPRPVLILGETGSGKETAARALHHQAAPDAADAPFFSVNCAAHDAAALEIALCGRHIPASFTQTEHTEPGMVHQAHGGTLLLDAPECLAPPLQRRLIEIAESKQCLPVGGLEPLPAACRLVAASAARDLPERVRSGAMVREFYDMVSPATLHVPPLRDRTGDIALLAGHFLGDLARTRPSLAGRTLSPPAIEALERYPFPGNVRELRNTVERAAFAQRSGEIRPEELGLGPHTLHDFGQADFHAQTAWFQRRLIHNALVAGQGVQARAARELGLSYHQFRYFYGKYFSGV